MNRDVGRRDARDAAQQYSTPAVGRFQILRAYLHGHASGHLAHRRQQRKRSIALANGFVRYRVQLESSSLRVSSGNGARCR